MQDQLLREVARETEARLTNRLLGKVFQLSRFSFAMDFGLRGVFLFVSVEPSSPRYYLIERRPKDLEKQAIPLSHFGQVLRAKVGGGKLLSVRKDPSDRIVRLHFHIEDETGPFHTRQLVAQLTGKAANLFLLDEVNRIVDVLRAPKGIGQQPGDQYQPPLASGLESSQESLQHISGSPSAFADTLFKELDNANAFNSRANTVRTMIHRDLVRQRKLKANLQRDLDSHGDPEAHKRLGDLLLANVSTSVRAGGRVRLTDYYSEGSPIVEVEIDPNSSLQEEASRQFRQYTKARRAREAIAERLTDLEHRICELEQHEHEIESIIRERDLEALARFDETARRIGSERIKEKEPERIPGVRRYRSSDGYEILLGRGAQDNDRLTFRLARPHDLWLHAGDYPGSHVIIRNPTRKPIPQRTIIEAAQLAGRFSQASKDSRVVVHYTERKFLSKPKGSAPGLVRMSSFRSITVEPKEGVSRWQ